MQVKHHTLGLWVARCACALVSIPLLVSCGGNSSSPSTPSTPTAPPAPPVVTISLSPTTVQADQKSVLAWLSTGASTCAASGAWSSAVAVSGNQSVMQAATGIYSYTLTCSGDGGSTAVSATLTVNATTPSITIAVSPSPISTDHSAMLTWTTTSAESCIAGGAWSGPQTTAGSMAIQQNAPGTYTYTLSCSNAGETATNSAVLTVVTPQSLTTTLTAKPASIAVGQSITLTWSSTGADSCTAYGGWSGTLGAKGSQSVAVTSTGSNVYELQCSSATGSGTAQVTVQGLTASVTLTASPTTTGVGEHATLTWSTMQATSCVASGGWSGALPSSGSQVVTPATAGAHVYTLTCSNPGAPAQASVTVMASNPVVSLTVFPTSVVAGKTVTVRWTGKYADSCVASGAWSGSLSASGYQTLPTTTPGSEEFDISCSNAGGSAGASASTVVSAAPPSPPATAYRINEAHDGVLTTTNGIEYPAASAPAWTVDLGEPVSFPLIAGGKVFVVTDNANEDYGNQLYALDGTTGATLWGPIEVAGVYFGSGLTYDNGRLFVLMFDGGVHAFDASTGAALWSTQLPGYWYEAAPNAYGGTVYFVGNAGLSAIDESTGTILWTTTGGSTDWDSPAISSAGIYAESGSCQAGAYDPTSGTPFWQISESPCNGPWGYASIVKNGTLFGRVGGSLTLIDAASGAQHGQIGSQLAPAITDTAVIALNAGVLSSTRLSDLVQTWTFTGDGKLVTAPVVVNDTVLIGSSSGNVYGLNVATGVQVWQGVSPTPINPDSENGGPMPPSGPAAGENLLIFLAGTQVVAWTFQ